MGEIRGGLRQISLLIPNFLLIGGSVVWVPDTTPDGKPVQHARRFLDAIRVRHTAFVFHSGKELLAYDKRTGCTAGGLEVGLTRLSRSEDAWWRGRRPIAGVVGVHEDAEADCLGVCTEKEGLFKVLTGRFGP